MTQLVRLGLFFLASTLAAQSLRVLSEFRRVDPFGEIVPQDRGGRPREILSPLVARNSHSTFRIVVEAPPGKIYYFYVVDSPANILKVTVYKEMYTRVGESWVPDLLVEIKTPYISHVPDRYHGLPNQTAESFLADVFVPADAPPGRMKLDAQLHFDKRWIIYPMEIRISDVVAPAAKPQAGRLPPLEARSDAAALGPLRSYLCGAAEPRLDGPLSARWIIRRNAAEDMALAEAREAELGKEGIQRGILRGLGIDAARFCASTRIESPLGPEWYLRGRDFLYRGKVDP